MADYYGIDNLTLDVDLANPKSVADAQAYLHDIPHKIERARLNAISELEERIVDRLHKELALEGLSGSSVAKDIRIEHSQDGFTIVIDNDHAMYVEFGTGIVGENSPHPNPNFNGQTWMYDVNGHGEAGWWYPTDESDSNPTKYYSGATDTWWALTKGMPARPFMYRTWRYARLIITKTFNKHLRRELSK